MAKKIKPVSNMEELYDREVERSLSEINFNKLCKRKMHPSPSAWEDQVLYFLMLDRFSDGAEAEFLDNNGMLDKSGTTPLFQDAADNGNAIRTPEEAAAWRNSGGTWVGGTLKGLKSKIGYLKRLGVTAIWVSPLLKQVYYQDTYHGYAIQNYLDVDPHFGSREDFQDMVATAHEHGIYVILDIIINHSGNVFSYTPDSARHHTVDGQPDFFWDGGCYRAAAYHDKSGKPSVPFEPDKTQAICHAIWPVELQAPASFTQKGFIRGWDNYPEYLEGDFFNLKDIELKQPYVDSNNAAAFVPSAALLHLCEVYKFWIAFADLDGFRLDTVKHMELGATRFFTNTIREFAQSIGKENFYIIGEITGGRDQAYQSVEETGISAALGIDDTPDRLEALVKGECNPDDYFSLFRNSLLVNKGAHTWFNNKIVTLFEDHDEVRKGNNKARFSATPDGKKLILNAFALNATTLGIPCIYYGSEQGFDGAGDNDRYLREAMFGGAFGAFRSRDRHFFNENHPLYIELAKILAVRSDKITLRRGRQYLREISGDGITFGYPQFLGQKMLSIIPWSRIFNQTEILLAINTDTSNHQMAWTTIDSDLHSPGNQLRCIYASDPSVVPEALSVVSLNARNAVQLTVPAHGFVIYEKVD
ncbi:alpha-amylase family glycosyl hydrolase [Azotosporobacter soli]|uniref:alpha-amylase family glycosyl hydrolase n=1 Tax=Azotosporobacter soli TaxID=3055040 RepID=UPI0031FED21E